MNPHDQMMEALGILQEECAEAIVVISKIRRFGLDTEYLRGQGTKRTELTKELGDIIILIGVLAQQGIIDQDQLYNAAKLKIEKLKKYSNLKNLDNLNI